MTRKEIEVVKENRQAIIEAVREILYDTDCAGNTRIDTDIYLYVDEDGNIEVQPYYTCGNTWKLDDHHTIHTIQGYNVQSWEMWYESISDISEALDIPEDKLIEEAAEYFSMDPSDIECWDILKMIGMCYAYSDEEEKLKEIRAEALKENFWDDYTEHATKIVDDYIENEERFVEEA